MVSSSRSTSTLCSELSEKFHPGKLFKFPKCTFGKKNEECYSEQIGVKCIRGCTTTSRATQRSATCDEDGP